MPQFTSWFTLIFIVALALSLTMQLWLARRQVRHVASNRPAPPPHFANRITLAAHQKAADYTIARTRLGMLDTVLDALVLLALTLGGGLAALAARAELLPAGTLWQEVGLVMTVTVVAAVIGLPIAWYRTFVIEQRFGFNRMTLGLWLADLAKTALLGALLGIPLLTLVLWLMARAGTWWWLYAWLAWVVFQLLMLLLFPTVIAPLFNKFRPLADDALRARVERLLVRCGFAAKGLFVMDGSRRSSHGNAYFTGFGAARRIVFFDTLLSRLQPEEVEAVLAHELGHFKLKHVIKRIAWFAASSLVLLALLGWLIGEPWFYAGLGVPVAPPRAGVALVLFMLVLPVFTFRQRLVSLKQ